MKISELLDIKEHFKSHPWITLICIIVAVVLFVSSTYLVGYLIEKGRQAAGPLYKVDEQTNDETTDSQENKYIRVSRVSPREDAKYAMIVEFGVKEVATEGVYVGIDVSSKYTAAFGWFGQPLRTDVPENAGGVYTDSSEKREPPIYVRKFSTPSISPKKSYYLYFESNEPLKVKQVMFKEYYDE